MLVSGHLGEKVPVVDRVLFSHAQEIYPTTLLGENCVEFKFSPDRIFYNDLRQTYLALKLKFVEGRGYETYKTKNAKKEHKKVAKLDVETERSEMLEFLSLLM